MKRMIALSLLLLVLSGCGFTTKEDSNEGSVNNSSSSELPELGSEERKQLNAEAGEITYMTGFYYAASPPDIQVFIADELGYFDQLGLNVNIVPGLDAEGMKYVAANKAQLASAGTPSQVIQSVAQGAEISGIATFGSVGTSALLVMEDSEIYKPEDLKGKQVGFHGALPANLIAMLQYNGMKLEDIKGVSVGYDVTLLSSGKIDALTVYKSNEPYQLEKMGEKVRVLDPGQFGAETSFGVLTVNNKWATQHQTAVEDFLRALLKAHQFAAENPEQAIEMIAARSESLYDKEAELNRWKVELELLSEAQDPAVGIGWQTEEQWEREVKMLLDAKVIEKQLGAGDVMNNSFLQAVYDGPTLIWQDAQ